VTCQRLLPENCVCGRVQRELFSRAVICRTENSHCCLRVTASRCADGPSCVSRNTSRGTRVRDSPDSGFSRDRGPVSPRFSLNSPRGPRWHSFQHEGVPRVPFCRRTRGLTAGIVGPSPNSVACLRTGVARTATHKLYIAILNFASQSQVGQSEFHYKLEWSVTRRAVSTWPRLAVTVATNR
jgi:hypothetical protein